MRSSKKTKRSKLLSKVIFSKPVILIASKLARLLFQLLVGTIRLEVRGGKTLEEYVTRLNTEPNAPPLIIALWHNQLLLVPLLRRFAPITKASAIISKSRDGDWLAAFVKTFRDADVIRVGHSSRHGALLQMIDALNQKIVVLITPDGPRGPRYEVKDGVIYSAKKSNALIFPLQWQASHIWELNTWDKFRIPRPFSKVTMTISEPIACADNLKEHELKESLQTRLS